MISFQRAIRKVLAGVEPLAAESMPLAEALGLALAEPVAADRDIPPFDRSAMDGYAVRASDTTSAPVRLELIGEAVPGRIFEAEIRPGQAARIMTGAPVPAGADAVQIVEVCEEGQGAVTIGRAVRPGANMALRGEDAAAGQAVLEPGAVVTPAAVSLLASVGRSRIACHRQPSVALAQTGSEVVGVDERPSPAQIRNANGPALAARLARAGARVQDWGVVEDRPEEVDDLLTRFVRQSLDALVLTGGVSMGRHDYVADALRRAGARLRFDRVAVKPGKPTTFALLDGRPVLALPGNPVSCLVTAELFVAPALRRMRGLPDPGPALMRAELRGPVGCDAERTLFLPATLRLRSGVPTVYPIRFNGSGDYVHFAGAQALVIVEPETGGYEEHAIVDIIVLEGGQWQRD